MSDLSTPPPLPPTLAAWPAEERALLPFLPLVYVAWADGVLSAAEIDAIRRHLDRVPDLGVGGRARVARWLDPLEPPPAAELAALLALIRQARPGLPVDQRWTLSQLGIELARQAAPDGAPPPLAVAAALSQVEQALGVAAPEAARGLLPWSPGPPPPEPAPAFPVADLTALLDGPHRATREAVRRFLSQPRFAYAYGLPLEEHRARTLAICRELAAQGWGAVSYPPECGGRGDLGEFVAVFETLAFHDFSVVVKFGVQFGLFGGSILQLGTAHHHRRYLPRVATLELPGCFAMTERGHGSNVRDLETLARYDPERQEFEIHTPGPSAQKEWIGNAARDGQLATVFAQLWLGSCSYGVHAFLVPLRDAAGRPWPGVVIEDDGVKEGLLGVDNGRLSFDRVRIPRENLLDRFAQVSPEGEYSSPIPGEGKRFFTMLGTLVGGRVSVARAALSAAKTGLTIAVRYGARRRQFGPEGGPEVPVLDYLTHQRRLLPRLATAYAFHFALDRLQERYLATAGGDTREVEAEAAGLKAAASWFAVDTLQVCRECCGGQGYLAANRLGVLRADLDVFTTFEGDNTVLLQLVARSVLTAYRKQFSDLRLWGVVKLVAERAAVQLAELNPVVVRRSDDEHLLDPSFHRAAFRYREERLLASAAGRLRYRLEAGEDSFAASNAIQDHLVELARAWVDRRLVEGFQDAVEERDGPLGEILRRVAALAALARLEERMAWFLRSGYLEAGKSRAIRSLVNRLCRELRPQAVPLVDAFGIPDELLAAPIAVGGPG
jgi:acyl-CoA oxidase